MQTISKAEAQQRADRVGAFREELELLEREGVIALAEEQRAALNAYHDTLIERLASQYDIDASGREKQLTFGMKVASFIGALGLAASIFYLFYQFWGRFSTTMQLVILVGAPLAALAATLLLSERERNGYFTKLLGLVAFAAFVLNISMLGQIFNIAPSPNAFAAWAVFALLVAYASDTRLLLAAGILSFAAFLSAKMGTWSGLYWLNFGERPEHFFPAALALFLVPLLPHHRFSGFTQIYRVFAMLLFFLPVLVLANWGVASYLPMGREAVEGLYQVAGFGFSGAAIWLGVQRGWTEVVNTGNVFFTVFLYTKFYDWWWEWMPKYLFFLVIALTAVLMLLLFKRLRRTVAEQRERG